MAASPSFCEGIDIFRADSPLFAQHGAPVFQDGQHAVANLDDPAVVFQTMLHAQALRYLTMHVTASKESGHPGGFTSQAEAFAACVLLGHKNILTEVGHHAPGFYSALFLDTSLEQMGIKDVRQMCQRFREMHGLIGHLSGMIPGVLAPAGPLGQGQHFAMAAAYLNRGTLFPFTLGDGGMGEPYIVSSINHFHTCFPEVTNFLPMLVWNGWSQEHMSMVSTYTNEQMRGYWIGNGFDKVVLVDAKEFDKLDQQPGPYVDSTFFPDEQRMAFTHAVLHAVDEAAKSALGGKLTMFIIKQLKGAGIHAYGAKSHNLKPGLNLQNESILGALKHCALSPAEWGLVRHNAVRAAGGPAGQVNVTEVARVLPPLPKLALKEHTVGGDPVIPTGAMADHVVAVGKSDSTFLATNADGNEASGIGAINVGLKVIHPTSNVPHNQDPRGQVYEPLSEDACAGMAVALNLMGGRSFWCSYESFAVNGWGMFQTVTQAMAELRRATPSIIALFTAGAIEQGRNGWTHQRPEIEAYMGAMMRNGNVFPLFPVDANSIQVAYEWALGTVNKGVAIFACKGAMPVHSTLEQTRYALANGGFVLKEAPGRSGKMVVLAVVGDITLMSALKAADLLVQQGVGVRIVCVVSPRRLYRPSDVAWETCAESDGSFTDDATFDSLFSGDALIGMSSGPPSLFEPVLLRTRSPFDVLGWKRGETSDTAMRLLEYNGLGPSAVAARAAALLNRSRL